MNVEGGVRGTGTGDTLTPMPSTLNANKGHGKSMIIRYSYGRDHCQSVAKPAVLITESEKSEANSNPAKRSNGTERKNADCRILVPL